MPPADPGPLTRERIVGAAAAIVDGDGVDALTMRGLGAELGVTAMALYRHVGSRDELLVALLDRIAEQIVHPEPVADPVRRAVDALLVMRAFLAEHPWVLRLILSGQWSSRRGLWFTDAVLAAARDAGLDDAAAVAAWTTLWQVTAGELAAAEARRSNPSGPGWTAAAGDGDGELPTLRELIPRWGELAAPFEERLPALVAALFRAG